MDLSSVLKPSCIAFGQDLANKEAVLDFLAHLLAADGAVSDEAAFRGAVADRERLAMTGLQDGIAIPHGISDAVVRPAIAYVRIKRAVPWETIDDKPVDQAFLLAIPTAADGNKAHIRMLSALATALIKPEVIEGLGKVGTAEGLISLLQEGANS